MRSAAPGCTQTPAAPLSVTFEAYVAQWLARRSRLLKPRTTATYADVLGRYIVPHVGERDLVEISRGVLVQLLDGLAAKKSPRTVRLTYTALHCVLADAVEAGYLAFNPAAKLAKRYPIPKDEAPCYTRAQVLAFLREAILTSAELAALFAVMFGAGLRVGEVRGLQKWDVNLDAMEIRVERALDRNTGEPSSPKSRRSRKVAVMASLEPTLRELVASRTRWLFPSTRGPRGYQVVRRAFREIAERATLPVYSPKALRHAFGSVLAEVGVDLRAIQDAMGHADTRTTLRYAGHFPVRRSKQLDEL